MQPKLLAPRFDSLSNLVIVIAGKIGSDAVLGDHMDDLKLETEPAMDEISAPPPMPPPAKPAVRKKKAAKKKAAKKAKKTTKKAAKKTAKKSAKKAAKSAGKKKRKAKKAKR